MEVIIDTYGTYLGKKSERLQIRKEGKTFEEIPFSKIEQITLASMGVSISADIIYECMQRGITLNFLSSSGKPYAMITSPDLTGTVLTRREQLLAYFDQRGVTYSKAIAEGKIKNQVNLLKYFGKYRKTSEPDVFKILEEYLKNMEEIEKELPKITGEKIDDVRFQILSVEGRVADVYWKAVKHLLAKEIEFLGRGHQGAEDPVNSLLNYGYGILYSRIWGALLLAGLEPFAGFLHVDRPGKPSLVLDAIEEFRQPVVDRVVFSFIGKGCEIKLDKGGQLEESTRKSFSQKVLERLESQERYEGKKFKLKTIIQRQARHLATFLRGERNYKPFICGW